MKNTGTYNMKIKTLVVAGFLGVGLSAQGAVVASYDFTSNAFATSADFGATAFAVTVGPGLSGGAGYSGSGNMFSRASVTDGGGAGTLTGAIAADDYLSFTILAHGSMDLTSLELNAGYSRTGGFSGKTLTANLLTSVNGFTTGALVDSSAISSDPLGGPTYAAWSIDLSGPSYQDLTGPIEFRLYLYDDTSDSNTIHRLDDIVLNGSIIPAAPEPSSLALLVVGAAMLKTIRKKRLNAAA